MTTTNYFNTLIEIAEDSVATEGEIPPLKAGKKTAAYLQYEMLVDQQYEYTSDDVLFSTFAVRKEIAQDVWEEARAQFFSKGQPCFRASPLTKRYGWGIHSNAVGKVAMYAVNSIEYQRLLADDSVVKKKGMRSKRR